MAHNVTNHIVDKRIWVTKLDFMLKLGTTYPEVACLALRGNTVIIASARRAVSVDRVLTLHELHELLNQNTPFSEAIRNDVYNTKIMLLPFSRGTESVIDAFHRNNK